VKFRRSYLAALVAFGFTLALSHGRSTPYNNEILLADALLHGHFWIDWPGPYIDAVLYNGHRYSIEGPTPALLALPLVAIWSTAANQTFLAVVLCAVAVGAAWELCERYGVDTNTTVWLCAFLWAGTDLAWCAMLGDVWFIEHVSAVCFTLLALVELAGKRRGWLVAIWAVCALQSRFPMVLAVPVYLALLLISTERPIALAPRWRARLLGAGAVLAAIGALLVAYNFARWGTLADIGYTVFYHQDPAGSPTGSPFQLQNIGLQVWSFFVQTPTRLPGFPWLKPEYSGVALTWTSPALVLAFLARRPAGLVIALWSAAVLVAIPDFLYFTNGFAQFGMRRALDFEPFLFALIALAVRDRMPPWGYVLIAYSTLVGLWGCWYWNAFVRPGN
jgi:hypothetical protein